MPVGESPAVPDPVIEFAPPVISPALQAREADSAPNKNNFAG
jgi:hypothetical protein